jgi:hypothetical protein
MHQRRTCILVASAFVVALGFWGCSYDDSITEPP